MAPVLPMQQTAVQCCSLERPQELCPQDLCLQRLLAAMGGQQDGGGKGGKGAPPTVPGTGAPPRPPHRRAQHPDLEMLSQHQLVFWAG